MSRAVARSWWLVCLALAGCAPDPLEGVDVAAVRRLAQTVDERRVVADIETLVAVHRADRRFPCENLEPSPPAIACQLTHEAARSTIDARLFEAGLEPRHHGDDDPRLPTVNITADLRGATRPDEVVIMAAHYDVFYAAANDNGSGVAAVLETARVLAPHAFDRTVRFVFFDLEELGLIGSSRYVDGWSERETLVAALVLDMIGYADHSPGSQQVPPGFTAPDVGDFLALFADGRSEDQAVTAYALNDELEAVRLEALIAPSSPSPARWLLERSDHAPFWLAGLPALLLTDTGNYRNPYYHTASDTLGTIDLALLGGGTRLCVAAVAAWAGGPR